jgi:probable F420-dependent oxidoreductase
MKIGLYGINMGACVDPDVAASAARAAEDAGFDSVWTAEHVVLPEPRTPESPVPARTPLLDPAVALAHIAAHTERIKLATGIIILPQRNPVVLAKELATVDVLSRGRLVFGLGAGYIPAEFAALGKVFEERGARTDEAIEVLRTLWTAEAPRFEGRFFRFADIDAQPRPVQKPHPPIVVGGMSRPALRRAVRQGDGWYGFALDLDATARCIEGLRQAEQEGLRPDHFGPLEVSVTPAGPLDADTVRRYEDLGVHRLIPIVMGEGTVGMVSAIEKVAAGAIDID